MNIASILIAIALTLFSLIGLIVGLVKGFTKVKTWASEYVIAAFITIGIGAALKYGGVDPVAAGIITLICAVALLLGFTALSKLLQKIITKKFEKRDDELRSYGGLGVFNKVWGGLTLALKGFTICVLIVSVVLVVLDLSQIEAIRNALPDVYDGAGWYALEPIVFDFYVVGLMHIAIRHGYANGVASALWGLIVVGLAVGAFFMAYGLVYSSGVFNAPAEALGNNISGWFSGTALPEGLALNIAKGILTAAIFLILLIVVLVASFFVSRVITFARLGKAFYVADGIIGAIVLYLIIIAAMLFIGAIIQPLQDFEFMKAFDNYFDTSTVAIYFYKSNLLIHMGLPEILPIAGWLS